MTFQKLVCLCLIEKHVRRFMKDQGVGDPDFLGMKKGVWWFRVTKVPAQGKGGCK